ncbi:replicative DNA helicase [Auraticoccus monumenti]|uniref:DNA 5'-3' helicase n=1 Tax=Auraticoccus monumenti TaxID=675864 RepID=A0A1G6UMN5_9ACTN|nr:replicative DNA helicase [Auraticoccus monumenti]SDD42612.1 replicative DNA helicase [Auraticoccus monumenti]
MTDLTPPHDFAAEQAVLGAMLISRDAITTVTSLLSGPDFYRPAHEFVFDAITALDGTGRPVDPVTVGDELRSRGTLANGGGLPYLAELFAAVDVAANAGYHAQLIRTAADRRRLIDLAAHISQRAHDPEADPIALVEKARLALDAATPITGRLRTVDEILPDVIDELQALQRDGRRMGHPFPWREVNERLHGLVPGRFFVLGARPAQGKSMFAQNCAESVAATGQQVLYLSLEMTQGEVTRRMLSNASRVSMNRLQTGQLADSDWERIADGQTRIPTSIAFDEDPRQTVGTMRRAVQDLLRRGPVGLVILDYIQLVTPGDANIPRQEQVSQLSRGCKLLAKEFAVPVLALAQMNRGIETRADKKPVLSDLRESGSLEQDADVVLFLQRGEGEADSWVTLHCAKFRHGQTFALDMSFEGHYSRIAEIA